jgi:voltage-gated potassium channel
MNIQDFKIFIFDVLEHQSKTRLGVFLEHFLIWIIFFNVLFAILETLPEINRDGMHTFFLVFDSLSVLVFVVEYILRIWTCPLHVFYSGKFGRIRYVFSPLMLFDLFVILPFFFSLPFFSPVFNDQRVLRIFRLIRIFRVLRIAQYSIAVEHIFQILKQRRNELIAVFTFLLILIVLSSTFVYHAEKSVPNTNFTSIPITIWWSIETLSTVGYGDMIPQTFLGKFFTSISILFGVAIFALPTAILGASFYAEIKTKERESVNRLKREIKLLKKQNTKQDSSKEISSPLMENLV